MCKQSWCQTPAVCFQHPCFTGCSVERRQIRQCKDRTWYPALLGIYISFSEEAWGNAVRLPNSLWGSLTIRSSPTEEGFFTRSTGSTETLQLFPETWAYLLPEKCLCSVVGFSRAIKVRGILGCLWVIVSSGYFYVRLLQLRRAC